MRGALMTPESTRSLPIFCVTCCMRSNIPSSLYGPLKELSSANSEKGCWGGVVTLVRDSPAVFSATVPSRVFEYKSNSTRGRAWA
jgi:hypothetical protein